MLKTATYFGIVLSGLDNSAAIAQDTILFKQPSVSSISDNFCVKCNFPPRHFNIVQWEANPNTPDGSDVPATWDMGEKTGFRPHGDLKDFQLAINGTKISSGAQMQGDTVGAFISSADFPNGCPANKVIITPNITFDFEIPAFGKASGKVEASFDLQVPYAHDQHTAGNTTYVVSDLSFRNRLTGTSIWLNEMVFHNGVSKAAEFVFYDPPTKMPAVFSVDSTVSQFTTPGTDSLPFQVAPWTGWKHFSYFITAKNFQSALAAVGAKYPASNIAMDVADWRLTHWHLNAELLCSGGIAEMGWSMRRATIGVNSIIRTNRAAPATHYCSVRPQPQSTS